MFTCVSKQFAKCLPISRKAAIRKQILSLCSYRSSSYAKVKVDALVIGGGPSGVSCAIELMNNGLSVAVIEKESRSSMNEILNTHSIDDQLVGECVNSTLLTLLKEKLKMSSSIKQAMSNDKIMKVCGGYATDWSSNDNYNNSNNNSRLFKQHIDKFRHPFSYSILLNRNLFNHLLWNHLKSFANENSEYQTHTHILDCCQVEDICLQSDDINKTGIAEKIVNVESENGEHVSISTKFVCDCSGNNGNIRKLMKNKCLTQTQYYKFDNLTAITRHYDLLPDSNAEDISTGTTKNSQLNNMVLTECHPNGWFYSSLLPNNEMVVSFLCDAEWIIKQNECRILNELYWYSFINNETKHTKKRLTLVDNSIDSNVKSEEKKRKYKWSSAHSGLIFPCIGNWWISIGDAAMSVDPLSSLGIGHAISCGINGAQNVTQMIRLTENKDNKDKQELIIQNYSNDVLSNFKSFYQRKYQFYQKEKRFDNSPFWRKRKDKNTFDKTINLIDNLIRENKLCD